jgi:DNA-binding transcriptional MerR regulator
VNRKDELLSIGEMAKITGASIQALRYYERKGIFTPAYTDPDTGYRYYAFEQANSIDVISACVELGIPLKELADLFNTEDLALLQAFFIRNKEAAERKRHAINTMLCLADKALSRMEQNRPFELGGLYTADFPEKVYCIKPCGHTLENKNRTKLLIDFAEETKRDLSTRIADHLTESMVLMDYGFLCKHSATTTEYYTFAEVPKILQGERTLTIPQGICPFTKNKTSQITNAAEIFRQHLRGREEFITIEVEEIISGKVKINEPIYNLRLIFATQPVANLHR